MGQNIQHVTQVVGGNATSTSELALRTVDTLTEKTISVTTHTTSASGTDQTVLAAQGAGIVTVLIGLVVTVDVATGIRIHWGNGTTKDVLRFNYLKPGGVAFNYAPWVLKSGANEALKVDVTATANITYTVYYYTE